jgi:hypothetical protein
MIYRNIWGPFFVWADKYSRYHKWDLIFGIGWLREPIPKINFWYGLIMWADTKNGIRRAELRIHVVKYGSQSTKLKISLTPLPWLLGPTMIPWAKIFSPSRSFACCRALTALLLAKCCRHRVTRPSAAGAASFTFLSGALTQATGRRSELSGSHRGPASSLLQGASLVPVVSNHPLVRPPPPWGSHRCDPGVA